jgi:hypothetical protein
MTMNQTTGSALMLSLSRRHLGVAPGARGRLLSRSAMTPLPATSVSRTAPPPSSACGRSRALGLKPTAKLLAEISEVNRRTRSAHLYLTKDGSALIDRVLHAEACTARRRRRHVQQSAAWPAISAR